MAEKVDEVHRRSEAGVVPRLISTNSAGYAIVIGSAGHVTHPSVVGHPPNPLAWVSASNQPRANAAAVSGQQFFHQRRFAEAVTEFKTAVRLAPDNPLHHYHLAYSAWRANELTLVERHAQLAVRHDPRFASAHDLLGQWYLHNAQYEPALRHSATAVSLAPGNTDILLSRGFVLAGAGDARGAWALLEPVMDDPTLAERVTILYLKISSKIGRDAEAAEWALRHLSRHLYPPVERPQLLFALANVLDRLGRFDEAITQVRTARQLLNVPYDPVIHERGITARIESFSAERMESLPRSTRRDSRPVFIVGMPRSGTSLVEQILSSHPSVHGAGELEDLLAISARVGGPDGQAYPQTIGKLNAEILDQLAGSYLSRIDSLAPRARYVVDKMPLNFLELGLIELLFPDARIIHCVRDPMDTCLSCYMNDIAAGVGFARDQRTLAGYFRQYERLMDHWKRVLRLPVLEVRYEEVVADLEGQAHRLLGFMGLSWDERCLRFHENNRGVATASRDQVRRPLYASSVGRWKNYREQLGELAGALGVKVE